MCVVQLWSGCDGRDVISDLSGALAGKSLRHYAIIVLKMATVWTEKNLIQEKPSPGLKRASRNIHNCWKPFSVIYKHILLVLHPDDTVKLKLRVIRNKNQLNSPFNLFFLCFLCLNDHNTKHKMISNINAALYESDFYK